MAHQKDMEMTGTNTANPTITTLPPPGVDNLMKAAPVAPTATLAVVEQLIRRHYSPAIAKAVRAGLGAIASLSLRERDHCLVLIYEGASGHGKSIVLRTMMPDRPATEKHLLRMDDFTKAAFVSHAAKVSAETLEQHDLLPRVRDKVMLTKELAPLFGEEETRLRDKFATLTSVLDGNGLQSSSGVHGMRGYVGRYVFNWLGATTPIPERTHRVMAQLGNRILLYSINGRPKTEEELMDFAANYAGNSAVEECQHIVNDFIEGHFRRHPVESVGPATIAFPEHVLLQLVRYARLIACGRIELENDGGEFVAKEAEGPERIILLLQTLARGLALADGRTAVNAADLDIIRHITFSSLPPKRRALLQALVAAGGSLDSGQVEKELGVSRPTARRRMQELGATAIAVYAQGMEGTSPPAKIALAEEWRWLLSTNPTSGGLAAPPERNSPLCEGGPKRDLPS